VSYSVDKIDRVLKILEENHYYPFGLKHTNYNSGNKKYYEEDIVQPIGIAVAEAPAVLEAFGKKIIQTLPNDGVMYKYKYNGKELQDELGLNMYDYGARNYDPAMGRWMNMDALSEKYYPISPYVYAINNPMFFVDPDGNYIEIYYGTGSKEHQRYEYKKNRDYSAIDSPFLADALKALDALYTSSDIEVDGKCVNIMQTLMNSDKELSVAKSHEGTGSRFSPGKKFSDANKTSGQFYNNIGTIYFDNGSGVLFDDTRDAKSDQLVREYFSGSLPKTAKVNSATSELGHEMGHGYGFLTDPSSYWNRKEDTSGHSQTPFFKNKEEAKATTLSTQINIQLGENPRNNHRGATVPTQGVLSNKIKQ
jgi:RHS repeat-associated protein